MMLRGHFQLSKASSATFSLIRLTIRNKEQTMKVIKDNALDISVGKVRHYFKNETEHNTLRKKLTKNLF